MKKLLVSTILISAIYFSTVGILLMADPQGGILHVSLSLLKINWFDNYFVPGMIMFLVSIPFLISFYYLLMRKRNQYNWTLASGLLMLLFSGFQYNISDTSIWLDIFLISCSVFILLTSLQLKGKGLM